MRIIKKLCLLIASSGLTENQLREAYDWIDINGSRALETVVSEIRSAAEKAVLMQSIEDDNNKINRRNLNTSYKSKLKNTPSLQIINLLRGDAGLSSSQASERIVEALQESSKYNNIILPTYSKQGLRRWLEQLSNYVPYSDILHIAMKIRNKLLHVPESDWPLKDR
jgi:hypothetical protein